MGHISQILGFGKKLVMASVFNRQADPILLTPAQQEVIQYTAALKELVNPYGAGGLPLSFNSAPLSSADLNEVRARVYGLIVNHQHDPQAWSVVKHTQQHLFHRSVDQGFELAKLVYYNIRQSDGTVDQREIEMINEIAWIAKNSSINGLPQKEQARQLVASIEYANENLQKALRAQVESLAPAQPAPAFLKIVG